MEMRNLRFNGIWILSRTEKAARKIELGPHSNLIIGKNHTGKSTLIKTIYRTIGAVPDGQLSLWDQYACSILSITLNDELYYIFHRNGRRAIFSSERRLLYTSSDLDAWGSFLSKIFGYNLIVEESEGEKLYPNMASFFTPFYIDQDGSWQSKWNTFSGKTSGSVHISHVLDYFSGITPPNYYELKLLYAEKIRSLNKAKKNVEALTIVQDRFEEIVRPAISANSFEMFVADIDKLVVEVNRLNIRLEDLRREVVAKESSKHALQNQIRLTRNALSELDGDYKFLTSSDDLVCPTCGTTHKKMYLPIFEYVEDERVLKELQSRLEDDLQLLDAELRELYQNRNDVQDNYSRVSSVLDVKRGELTLNDVVLSVGSVEIKKTFREELHKLNDEVEVDVRKAEEIKKEIRGLANKKRRRVVLAAFRNFFAESQYALNLTAFNYRKMILTSRPDLAGSGGPRSILAYYGALWHVCLGTYGKFSVPLTIDAPQQNGQDKENFLLILWFLKDKLPRGAQIIVGLESEEDPGIEFDHVIRLSNEFKFLDKGQYDEVSEFTQYFEKVLEFDLHNRDSSTELH
jgi:hypothetical protein